jgi:hypothetical protein
MKVVKAEDVQKEQEKQEGVNEQQVQVLQEKFDVLQSQLNEKKYDLLLDEKLTSVLMNEVFPKFQWKGYESYAISETYNQLESVRTAKGIKAKFPVEIIEATFHFLKNFIGTGYELAIPFKKICDQFAIPVQEINVDRQSLKDLSLELVAAEKGIDVNELVNALNNMPNQG